MRKKIVLLLIVFVCSFYSINVKADVNGKCPTDFDTVVCKYKWKKSDKDIYYYEIQRDSKTKEWRLTGLERWNTPTNICGSSDLANFVSFDAAHLQLAQETGIGLLNKGQCPEFTIENKGFNTYYIGSFKFFTNGISSDNLKTWHIAELVDSISQDDWEQKFGKVQELSEADNATDGKGTCDVQIKYKYYGDDGDNTAYFESNKAILDYSSTPPTIQESSSTGGASITTHNVDSSFATSSALTFVNEANSSSCPTNLVLMCNETGKDTNKFTCNSLETLSEVKASSDVQEEMDLTPVYDNDTTDSNINYEYVGKDFCIQPEVQSIIKVASVLLLIVRLFVPIIIIVIGTFDLVKIVTSGDEKEINKAIRQLGARILIGLLVFLAPPMIDFFLSPFLKATSNGKTSEAYSDARVCEKCLLTPKDCDSAVNNYKSAKSS